MSLLMPKKNKRLIYLTGFMGSGKTTVGPILANTLGYSFIDIDQEIERRTGKNIVEIFSDTSEESFRNIEQEILTTASASTDCVVSLGGGTIADQINISIITSSGILVYLKADIDQIVKRVRNKTTRPLLLSPEGTMLPEKQLREKITSLLALREPYYARADLVISTDDRRVGLTIDEIVRRVKRL
jgi:shikimate kinase